MINSSSNQLLVLLLLTVSNIQSSQAPEDETKTTTEKFWDGWLRAERANDLRYFVSALPDFHRAVWDGNRERITSLLANPATDPNQVAEDLDITPLSTAAVCGQEAITALLLAHPQINVNKTDKDGATALYIATHHESNGVVRLLVAHPTVNINHKIDAGATALFKAACEGFHEIIRLLIRHGAENLQCSPPEGTSIDYFPDSLTCLDAAKDDETRQLMTQLWAEQANQQQQNADDDDDDDEELT